MRDVPVRDGEIRLGQFLKIAGFVGSGGEVKQLLDNRVVQVNGEREQRRGRQLRDGDVVVVGPDEMRVTTAP
jgi:ribosome-associated protein